MGSKNTRIVFFWTLMAVFILWDFRISATIDLRFEPPLIAAGSGKASSGAHCAIVGD
jgi:hypothetical protein